MTRSPAVVLVLDYPGLNSAQRTRALELERHGMSVRYPLEEARPRRTELTTYTAELADVCGIGTIDVDAVIAYCAAAPVARELARTVFAGAPPGLALIDPQVPTADLGLPGPLAATIGAHGHEWDGDSLAEAEAALARHYRDELFADVPEEDSALPATQLAAAQVDWMCHVLAAGDADQPPVRADELHVTSLRNACPIGCPARHLAVQVEADLLFTRTGLGADIVRALRDR